MSDLEPTIGILRVLRIDPGTTYQVRMLSDSYTGLFTHYFKGASRICRRDQCDPAMHKMERTWKGYAAVEVWNTDRRKWQPHVLEITEALELDFRGLFQRGQLWEIFREIQSTKRKMPIMGKLLVQRDPESMPPPFDFKAVLMHLFHTNELPLGALNPMPARQIVQESEGEAPPGVMAAEPERLDPSRNYAQELAEILKRRKTPTEKVNGKA